jgi:hypothetical protein
MKCYRIRQSLGAISLMLLGAGCAEEQGQITYVCDEPLAKYLALARTNIASDYEVERSTQVLSQCPALGYHRRYTFTFDKALMTANQPVEAKVDAAWCADTVPRRTSAELLITTPMLSFRFNYPWSTETGKYPPTEFRLHRGSLRGGFFDDLDWECALQETPE